MRNLIAWASRLLRRAPTSPPPKPLPINGHPKEPCLCQAGDQAETPPLFRPAGRIPSFMAVASKDKGYSTRMASAYGEWLAKDFPEDFQEALQAGDWHDLIRLLFEATIRVQWISCRFHGFMRKGG